ncbi:MAG: YraN family protein [Candidatus Aminicenantes bacterium]|nr:YraN family protein [Candidatus Aminicenantes bacterium]
MNELPSAQALGRTGEEAAIGFLVKNKFRVVATGFRLHRGEIDIIAYDGPTLVFIEVKTRSGEEFGWPEEAVTEAKQRQVRKIAAGYLMKNRIMESRTPCRFDVLSLVRDDDTAFLIRHIKNAF